MSVKTGEKYTIPTQVRIGHIHLKVSSIERSLEFYSGLLGFEITSRYGESAVFISAGGYHHHIGLNTWESENGRGRRGGGRRASTISPSFIPPARIWLRSTSSCCWQTTPFRALPTTESLRRSISRTPTRTGSNFIGTETKSNGPRTVTAVSKCTLGPSIFPRFWGWSTETRRSSRHLGSSFPL